MARAIETAEILAIGSELLVGETRDTNSGDLAAGLTAMGVEVRRATALPDRMDAVTAAFTDALSRVDLVVSTGGLGPTPDDLTREAIAAACGLQPVVDPDLEIWLRGLFERRGVAFPTANLKQAWLIDGAVALPNGNGTAPGWWVERPDGRVIAALPGPPREMRPIWQDEVVPRLQQRGVGADRAAETLRLTGIGESALVELIGEDILRTANPEVATYARVDAVDVRVSATGQSGVDAAAMVAAAIDEMLPRIGSYVFARGDETWTEALGKRLAGRTVSTLEIGTGGELGLLLGMAPWLTFSELLAPDSPMAGSHHEVRDFATRVAEVGGTDVGMAVRARMREDDTAVTIAIAIGDEVSQVTRTAFTGGAQGRRRAALLACGELWRRLAPESRV
ncbi:MAG: molybdopterin-binding protein [Candidatus Limnocylindrales bacterium]